MKIYPAIDILDGKVVRLTRGEYNKITKYYDDPMEIATKFINQGAETLHVIDLNGAKAGEPVNQETILRIAAKYPIQVGGGIRTLKDAEKYLKNGVKRIILGTSAILNPALIKKLDPEKIIVSLDIKDGKIAINGWTKTVKKIPKFKQIILTDTNRDGTLKGPNFTLVQKFINKGIEVIVAGGISTTSDLIKLEKQGAQGAIIGKALYENKIKLKPPNTLAKRIIPCMDIANGRVVKGTFFKNLKDTGDPIKLAKYYSQSGADELIFLDITATTEKRKTLVNLAAAISKAINIPFTVGGGIKTLEDISILLAAGADKISICSEAIKNPDLVKQASKRFGSQCIVISLDCASTPDGWELYINGGRTATGIDSREFAKKMELLGAGELLINSLNQDGTKTGYDLKLLKTISDIVNIPTIASSGAGCKEDILKAFTEGKSDAALAATLFHHKQLTIKDLKNYLIQNNITIRP